MLSSIYVAIVTGKQVSGLVYEECLCFFSDFKIQQHILTDDFFHHYSEWMFLYLLTGTWSH